MNAQKQASSLPGRARAVRSLAVISTACFAVILGACYSVEFVPAADYAGLRYREAPPVVEVVYERPVDPIRRLGVASIRDVADPRSDDFREFVIEEARRRGAPGAWIRVDRMRRAPHNTFGAWLNPGDGIGIVPVVLFARSDS